MGEANTAIKIQDLEQLVTRIVERFQPRKVILFGSYASGSPRPESDLDVLVVTTPRPARQRAYEVRAELQQNFPLELQLVFMDAEEFEETQDVVGGLAYPASHEGRLLYEKKP
jgi:predicted nucleotidyltransferase